MDKDYDKITERLLSQPYWVIDFLPKQVPPESPGQYFAVERYWTESARLRGLYARFASLLLKLCCYYDIRLSPALSEEWTDNPAPERIARWFDACAPGGGPSHTHRTRNTPFSGITTCATMVSSPVIAPPSRRSEDGP